LPAATLRFAAAADGAGVFATDGAGARAAVVAALGGAGGVAAASVARARVHASSNDFKSASLAMVIAPEKSSPMSA